MPEYTVEREVTIVRRKHKIHLGGCATVGELAELLKKLPQDAQYDEAHIDLDGSEGVSIWFHEEKAIRD